MANKKLVDRFIDNQQLNNRDGLYTRLKDRLPRRFGVHQASHILMVRHSVIDPVSLAIKSTDSLLKCHHISIVSRDLIGLRVGGTGVEGVEVEAGDWIISGVPRSYPEKWLKDDVQWFCLDPKTNDAGVVQYTAGNEPIGGRMMKLILLQDKAKNYLAWDMVMREFYDRSEAPDVDHICY